MPDITMCMDNQCKRNADCYRYMAVPSEYRQSYFRDSPRDSLVTPDCYYFMAIKEGDKLRDGGIPTA